MTDASRRVALVTGGGRGIGRAISLRLAGEGIDIAVNYHRDEVSAAATVAGIEALGGRARAYRASVASWDDDVAMADAVLADFGHVDILVHNGGIASRGNTVEATDPNEMERVVRTHAFGPFYLSKLLLPQMRELGRGDIIFISSVATDHHAANGSPYNMGKAAAEALALTLAAEEQQHGIRVNIVAPGLVTTDMGDRLAKAMTGGAANAAAELDAAFPFGRVARPDDVAEVVAFFVSEAGSYLSRQRVVVHGGGQPTSR
jgi:NAD(P)-dependent dehydrogenase (short-subunit alcohol dehydrogenase family)